MPGSTKHLISSILKADIAAISQSVLPFLQADKVRFDEVLKISPFARIPNLTHAYGFENIHKTLILLLGKFVNSFNLIRPMSEEQVIECAFDMVTTSQEDQLSIEDYVLFFKGARQGKYGKVLDHLDQQVVSEMLEAYRQERHINLVRIREEQHLAQKGLGPSDRTIQKDELAEGLCNIMGRMEDMKQKLKEQREINRANRL